MTIHELITKHEGRRNKPYKCPAGRWTIGIGHNMDANPLPPDIDYYLKQNGKITDDMVDHLFAVDLGHAVHDCHALFPDFDFFTENRRMALIDFLFQVGYRVGSRFVKTIAAINTNRWEDAAREMRISTWYQQTPIRAKEITEMIEVG